MSTCARVNPIPDHFRRGPRESAVPFNQFLIMDLNQHTVLRGAKGKLAGHVHGGTDMFRMLSGYR